MSHPARLLVLYLVLLALGTSHPFVLESPEAFVASDFFDVRLESLDPFTNLLLLVPLAVLARRLGMGRARAVVASFFASLAIELGQHWVAHRVSGVEDLVLNTIGAVFGAVFADNLARAASIFERPGPRWTLFAAVAAFVGASAAPPIVTPHLWRWSREAVAVAGSDPAGDVPWRGRVHAAALFAGAHAPDELPAPEWSLARDGNEAIDASMCDRIVAANGVTIDLDIEMPASEPVRPGALFMYAVDFNRLNLLVGHWHGQIRFRVKTRVTPILGSFPDNEKPLVLPAFPHGARRRLTLAFDGRAAKAYVDGRLEVDRVLPLPPHNGQRRFWLPRARWGAWLFVFSASLVVAAAAAGVLAIGPSVALAAGIGLGTEILQIYTFDRALDGPSIPFALAGAALGAFTGRAPSLAARADPE
jgi:VanZ family protein